ncbi:MAG: TetR/AcrR family transcriptional regulator [Roseobacter sp.]|jgi:AcrR family transcriptional regulator|nr:TetR/AcrR family transcriptional regulator [Roseobacter sp.]
MSRDIFALAAFTATAYAYGMKRQRHSRQTWIEAGLKSLITKGPSALAAEPLARELGTTKGSFYWHFKDVPEFQTAVVKHWQSHAFASVLQALEENGTAEQRLRRFGKEILASQQDPAMRAWASADISVAKAVGQVDAERLKYVTALLSNIGVTNDDFARGCLAALIGLPAVAKKTSAITAFDTLIDLVLALK